jgi:hypothetical protein
VDAPLRRDELHRTHFRNDFGVEHGGELIESRLSGFGEAPLRLIADELKANLIAQGWTEAPNLQGRSNLTSSRIVLNTLGVIWIGQHWATTRY